MKRKSPRKRKVTGEKRRGKGRGKGVRRLVVTVRLRRSLPLGLTQKPLGWFTR